MNQDNKHQSEYWTGRSNIPRPTGYVFFAVITILFVLARTWQAYPLVFPESGYVELLGVDSYFHLRHAEYSARHFPDQMLYDAGARYPSVGKQQVTGLFNLSIAATALLGAKFRPASNDVAKVAAWTPVLLSILALWVLFRFASFLGGFTAGAFSIMIFTLYPATSVTRGMLGFADQHVAEMLFALASVAGLVYCLDRTKLAPPKFRYRPAMLFALPFAAFFYVWIGTPMYIAVMALSLFVLIQYQILFSENIRDLAVGLFRFFTGAALWQLLVIVVWPDLLMELVKGMRWWNLGAMLAFAVVPAGYLWIADRFRSLPRQRILFVVISSLVVLLVVFLFFEFGPRGKTFSGWLLSPRNQNIAEQKIISPLKFWALFGTAGLLAALSIPFSVARGRRRFLNEYAIVPVVFGAFITFIWLRTHDFDYVPPIYIALMAGLAAAEIFSWCTPRIRSLIKNRSISGDSFAAGACSAVLGVFLILPIWPMGIADLPYKPTQEIKASRLQGDAWYKAMIWMRSQTPQSKLTPMSTVLEPIDEQPEGSYGIMTAWDYGNFVSVIGNRMPVSSRFPSKKSARWLTATTETEADSLLCQGCTGPENVRYVILDARLVSQLFIAKARAAGRTTTVTIRGQWDADGVQVPNVSFGEMYERAISTRLFIDDGLDVGTLRHIYESAELQIIAKRYVPEDERSGLFSAPIESESDLKNAIELTNRPLTRMNDFYLYDAQIVPEVKIFEVVKGARLEGIVAPGDSVSATIPLYSTISRRSFSHVTRTIADSTGHFELRLPYSTESTRPKGSTTETTGPYSVTLSGRDGASYEIQMPLEAVEKGLTITL